MIFLLAHKQLETSYGRGLVVKGFLHSSDLKVHKWYSQIRQWLFKVNRQNTVRGINWLFVYIARTVMYLSRRVHKIAHTTAENLSPKEALDVSTTVPTSSEFLKKIAENPEAPKVEVTSEKSHGSAGAIS
jgi:hypothetical protein